MEAFEIAFCIEIQNDVKYVVLIKSKLSSLYITKSQIFITTYM